MGILEHVYDPFKAVNNMFKMLKKDGIIFGMAPYLYYYHAPNDLNFQDYLIYSFLTLLTLHQTFLCCTGQELLTPY